MILGPAILSIIHPGSVDSKGVVSHTRTTALLECSFSFIDIIILFCCGVVYFFLLLFLFSFSLFFSNHQHVQLLIFHLLKFNILWGYWLTPNDTMRTEKIRLPTRKRKKEQSSCDVTHARRPTESVNVYVKGRRC